MGKKKMEEENFLCCLYLAVKLKYKVDLLRELNCMDLLSTGGYQIGNNVKGME